MVNLLEHIINWEFIEEKHLILLEEQLYRDLKPMLMQLSLEISWP